MDFACLKGGQIVVIDLNMQAKDLKTWKMREIENVKYQELHNSSLVSSNRGIYSATRQTGVYIYGKIFFLS